MISPRTYFVSFLLVFQLAVVSCATDIPKEEAKVEFKATFENESIGSVRRQWISSDRLAVSGASKAFRLSKADAGESAVFKGKAVPAQVYYAAMPFDALDSFSPSDPSLAHMELPCLQTASVNSIPDQARLAVSSTSDAHLVLRSPLSYLKFTIGPESGKIRSVSVISTDYSSLSGPFTVDCSSSDPYTYPSPGALSNVVLKASEEYLTEGDYYVAMFSGGSGNYELAFEDVDGKIALSPTSLSGGTYTERGEIIDYGLVSGLDFRGWDIRPVGAAVLTFMAQQGEKYIEYRSDCEVTAKVTKGAEWLSILRTKGVERRALHVVVDENPGERRLGQIVVESQDGKSRIEYNILQFGNPAVMIDRQRQALIDLYEATGGDQWHRNDNWCTDAPLSEWYGVRVDASGNLAGLYLSSNGLKGSLPENIGDLGGGTLSIGLYNNELEGKIPSSIYKIYYLDLDQNHFTSLDEPDDAQECIVNGISLSGNHLEGRLPEFFAEFPVLRSLDLSDNDFTGTIPSSYSRLMGDNLILYDNVLSGRLPRGIVDSERFTDMWPFILRQRGDGFDLDGVKIKLKDFTYNGAEKASDIFSANTFTAIVTNYPNEPDHEVMRQLALWYEAYKDSGFDVIYIGSQSAIRDYSTYPWHISSSTPGTSWSYVQSYATTTITLVDKDGYMVVDPFSAPDGVLDILEDEFGSLEDNLPHTPEGTVKVIQKASKGDGVDLVFLGDAFTSKMISDGLFDQAVNKAVEAFFSIAPMSDFRDHFNIYSLAVPSISSGYSSGSITAFDCWYGEGTTVGGNDSRCRDYTIGIVSKKRIDEAVTVVLMNSERYGGTSYLYPPSSGQYGRGWAVSYIPLCSDSEDFTFLVRHEAIGHAFAKLADENSNEANGQIPSSLVSDIKDKEKYGWWSNIDFTSDPSAIKWARFVSDQRYSSERIDVYKGGWGYWTGIWTPTWRSIMKGNSDEFNAPSREAIWKRVMSLSNGPGWTPTYEAFVEYDLGITEQ